MKDIRREIPSQLHALELGCCDSGIPSVYGGSLRSEYVNSLWCNTSQSIILTLSTLPTTNGLSDLSLRPVGTSPPIN